MRIHIINDGRGAMLVHKAGCADVRKALRTAASDWTIDVPEGMSAAAAAAADLNDSFGWTPESDEPQPWHEHDLDVKPCAR